METVAKTTAHAFTINGGKGGSVGYGAYKTPFTLGASYVALSLSPLMRVLSGIIENFAYRSVLATSVATPELTWAYYKS